MGCNGFSATKDNLVMANDDGQARNAAGARCEQTRRWMNHDRQAI
jgi:hypothetical protein